MQFVTTSEYTYWWPIKVKRPHPEKSGQWVTETFEMKFSALDQDKAEAIVAEIREIKDEAERIRREHDHLIAACRDWRGVLDGDKQQVPFGEDMLLTMLKAAPWYRQGIYEAYSRSLMADGGRLGN